MWTPGSDSSAELAEITAELVDITGLTGSPAYRAGSPQRIALDTTIAALAARQEQLRAQETVPAGFVWQGTGEPWAVWWGRQDTAGRNRWLRSVSVRLTFSRDGWGFEAGDLPAMAETPLWLRPWVMARRLAAGWRCWIRCARPVSVVWSLAPLLALSNRLHG